MVISFSCTLGLNKEAGVGNALQDLSQGLSGLYSAQIIETGRGIEFKRDVVGDMITPPIGRSLIEQSM